MGFAVPLGSWFRGPLRERVRQRRGAGALVETGMFDVAYLRSLVDEHQSGTSDYSAPLWTLLMFDSSCATFTAAPSRFPRQASKCRGRRAPSTDADGLGSGFPGTFEILLKKRLELFELDGAGEALARRDRQGRNVPASLFFTQPLA